MAVDGRLDLGEAAAELGHADDEAGVVGERGRAQRRVAHALDAPLEVGRGDLARTGRRVPVGALAQLERVGQAIVGGLRHLGGEVALRRDALGLVRRGGIGDELPRDGAQEVVGRDEGSGSRVEMIDVFRAQDAQRTAGLRILCMRAQDRKGRADGGQKAGDRQGRQRFLMSHEFLPHWRQGPRTRLNRRPDIVVGPSLGCQGQCRQLADSILGRLFGQG